VISLTPGLPPFNPVIDLMICSEKEFNARFEAIKQSAEHLHKQAANDTRHQHNWSVYKRSLVRTQKDELNFDAELDIRLENESSDNENFTVVKDPKFTLRLSSAGNLYLIHKVCTIWDLFKALQNFITILQNEGVRGFFSPKETAVEETVRRAKVWRFFEQNILNDIVNNYKNLKNNDFAATNCTHEHGQTMMSLLSRHWSAFPQFKPENAPSPRCIIRKEYIESRELDSDGSYSSRFVIKGLQASKLAAKFNQYQTYFLTLEGGLNPYFDPKILGYSLPSQSAAVLSKPANTVRASVLPTTTSSQLTVQQPNTASVSSNGGKEPQSSAAISTSLSAVSSVKTSPLATTQKSSMISLIPSFTSVNLVTCSDEEFAPRFEALSATINHLCKQAENDSRSDSNLNPQQAAVRKVFSRYFVMTEIIESARFVRNGKKELSSLYRYIAFNQDWPWNTLPKELRASLNLEVLSSTASFKKGDLSPNAIKSPFAETETLEILNNCSKYLMNPEGIMPKFWDPAILGYTLPLKSSEISLSAAQ